MLHTHVCLLQATFKNDHDDFHTIKVIIQKFSPYFSETIIFL